MSNPPISFAEWLAEQVGRPDPVGDLAFDAGFDDTWPTDGDYRTYRGYLIELTAGADVFTALARAWAEYGGSPNVIERAER